jgi:hypothetical protein
MSKLTNLIIFIPIKDVNYLKDYLKVVKGIKKPDDHDVEVLLSEEIEKDIHDTQYGERYEH